MDSEEIEKWDQESERAWKEDNHDVEFAESIVATLRKILKPNAKILDAGCGIGKHVKAFSKLGYEVEGLDQSKKAVEYARQLNPETRIMHMRLQDLYLENSYNLIHTCAVLQHSLLQRQIEILGRFYKALKPAGHYLCAECVLPNGSPSNGYSLTLKEWFSFMESNDFLHVKTIPPWPYYLFLVDK